MSINLSKGQKIDLTKHSRGLSRVMVGLGWDEAEQAKGLLGFLKSAPKAFDCDAFAVLLGSDGKVLGHTKSVKECTIYFDNLSNANGSVRHMGDNRTGAGEGDDEQIFVNLGKIPEEVCAVVFAVNIYDALNRKQHFGMIKNAFIRVVDLAEQKELCRYDLSENYEGKTALIAGKLIRGASGWEFQADGTGMKVKNLVNVVATFA